MVELTGVAHFSIPVSDPDRKESIRLAAQRRGLPYFEISAVTGAGLKDLVHHFFRAVAEQGPRFQVPGSKREAPVDPDT